MMKTMPASINYYPASGEVTVSPVARFGLLIPPPFSMCFNEEYMI